MSAPPVGMTLIDGFMPSYSLHQCDHVAVTADPATAWAAVRGFDLYSIGWARALFRLRTLPERIANRWRGRAAGPSAAPTARIEDITGDTGFHILGETAGREVVVGSVGKFWEPNIPFAPITPATFAAFDEPGYGRLAWSLRVDPREGGGAWITFELRVGTTDPASLARFRRYWVVIGRFSHAMRRTLLRAYGQQLGDGGRLDRTRRLPGDEVLPDADQQRTHAVTIEAPPSRVWPWLAQMGCQRAGFYSLDRLDNGGVPSAAHIIAELQRLEVGDVIPARPASEGNDGSREGFVVLRAERDSVLVIGSPELQPGSAAAWNLPYVMSWAFVLEPIGTSATRLTVRVRGAYRAGPTLRARATAGTMLAAHEIMERAQLRGLKRRAEQVA